MRYYLWTVVWFSVVLTAKVAESLLLSPSKAIKIQPETGAYLHIPFCRRRCHYCDFPILAIGNNEIKQRSLADSYTSVLCEDISLTAAARVSHNPLESIYFGGGTPSLLSSQNVETILNRLQEKIGIAPDAEITFEMDPGTFNREKLSQLKSLGINRASLGIQSFNDTILQKCGRIHRYGDILQAFDDLHAVDIGNISMDLISGLPELTIDKWIETLQHAVQFSCNHISVYDLQVEENTAFGRWYKTGQFPLPNEESAAEMYRMAVNILGFNDYEHYEISNYAKPGCRSRHNQKYWRCLPTFGFGMAAASLDRDYKRYQRPKTMEGYKEFIDRSRLDPYGATASIQTGQVDMLDNIMLSLRTADGLDLQLFEYEYGEANTNKLISCLSTFIERQLLLFDKDTAAPMRVKLVDPDGFLLSNSIISSVFACFP